MAPSLKQEVNLSRRACRYSSKLEYNKFSSNNQSLTGAKIICNNNNYNNNNKKKNSLIKNSTNNFNNKITQKCNLNMKNNNEISFISQFIKLIKPKSIGDKNKRIKNTTRFVNYSIICNNNNRMSVVLVLFGLLLTVSSVFQCVDARAHYAANLNHSAPISITSDEAQQINTIKSSDLQKSNFQNVDEDNGDLTKKLVQPHTSDDTAVNSDLDSHMDPHKSIEHMKVSQVDFNRVETPFIIGVWILSASIAKIGFHMTPKLNKIFPESCLLIVVGVLVGIILHFATSVHVSTLTPDIFFFYMLPPIILDAGYFMPNRLFFDNIGTILLMAVIGTLFNTGLIGLCLWACGLTGMFAENIPILHIFLFSSLISAVDPVAVLAVFEEIHVNEILYIVVFGESLLNDAVTVVLYHMFEAYNDIGIENIQVGDAVRGVASFFVVAFGGTVIGVIWGFLTGLVTRFTDHVRVIEPIFIFVMAYLAYLNAEIFHMSGILAITFCGITMKNYVEANISHKSHTTVKYALKMLSSSSETIIFIFLGVATVNNRHHWNTWFVLCTIFFCSVIRSLGVILLTWIANKFRLHKLSNVDKFVISYGGLRGAVAFALVLLIDKKHVPLQPMFVTTTIAVIYFTVFLQGITIKPLVRLLKVKRANKRKPTMNERIHEKVIDHLMAGVEDIIGKPGNYNVRDKFKRFDTRFIRPLLIRDLQSAEPKILETYSKLTMKDAIDIMRRNPSNIGQLSNTESMSALFRNYTGVFGGSPSFSNLENCSRNLDMQELDYNPSKKDLTDAKIHHLLAEELKPYRRHRRLSYSRHAVDDRDLSTQVNYRTQINMRRIVSDRHKHHKRSKRIHKDGSGKSQNHVSFPEFQQNGSAKQLSNDYINEVLQEGHEDDEDKLNNQSDEWEGGLTFTAKPTRADNVHDHIKRISKDFEGEDRTATPTAIDSVLPWKRDDEDDGEGGVLKQNEFPAWASNKEYLAYNSPSATFLGGLSKPKQVRSVIGLFRRESSGSGSIQGGGGIVGGLNNSGVGSGTTDSDTSVQLSGLTTATTTPINSATNPNINNIQRPTTINLGGMMLDDYESINRTNAGPFPVTASHRRNTRRGSLLELSGESIPEENYTKSLPEREKFGARRANNLNLNINNLSSNTNGTNNNVNDLNENSGTHQPLLRINTPKAQIRRHNQNINNHHNNPQSTSLLSSSSTDDDEDDDDDDDNEFTHALNNKNT